MESTSTFGPGFIRKFNSNDKVARNAVFAPNGILAKSRCLTDLFNDLQDIPVKRIGIASAEDLLKITKALWKVRSARLSEYEEMDIISVILSFSKDRITDFFQNQDFLDDFYLRNQESLKRLELDESGLYKHAFKIYLRMLNKSTLVSGERFASNVEESISKYIENQPFMERLAYGIEPIEQILYNGDYFLTKFIKQLHRVILNNNDYGNALRYNPDLRYYTAFALEVIDILKMKINKERIPRVEYLENYIGRIVKNYFVDTIYRQDATMTSTYTTSIGDETYRLEGSCESFGSFGSEDETEDEVEDRAKHLQSYLFNQAHLSNDMRKVLDCIIEYQVDKPSELLPLLEGFSPNKVSRIKNRATKRLIDELKKEEIQRELGRYGFPIRFTQSKDRDRDTKYVVTNVEWM